jgi:hypothetical protein
MPPVGAAGWKGELVLLLNGELAPEVCGLAKGLVDMRLWRSEVDCEEMFEIGDMVEPVGLAIIIDCLNGFVLCPVCSVCAGDMFWKLATES